MTPSGPTRATARRGEATGGAAEKRQQTPSTPTRPDDLDGTVTAQSVARLRHRMGLHLNSGF